MLAKKTPFQQSSQTNKDGVQVVFLEDDDPACMLIIMNAMHLQGHRVPQHLTLRQLHQIAVLSDKYDLGRSLGTWGHLWAKPYTDYIIHGGHAKLLFVSIVFTIADLFSQITKYIVLEASICDEDLYLETEVDAWSDGIHTDTLWKEGVPESVSDSLRIARAETVNEILAICHKRICRLRHERGGRTVCPHKSYGSESADCDALNLGSIIHGFPDLSDEPDASVHDQRSVSQIRTGIELIRPLSEMEILRTEFKRRHADSCNSTIILQRRTEGVVDNVEGLQLLAASTQPAPEAPDWVQNYLDCHREEDDQCQITMRYTAVSDTRDMHILEGSEERGPSQVDTRLKYVPMIECLDCPGRLYMKLDDEEVFSGIDDHLVTILHVARREKRVAATKAHPNLSSGGNHETGVEV